VLGLDIETYWFVRREQQQPVLALADVVLSIFPIAWAFNRAAAALAHDHPGMRAPAASLFAVAYPDSGEAVSIGFGFFHGSVPRYDLSLIDFAATLVIVCLVLLTWQAKVRIGTYVCLVGVTYASTRFVLDFLRPGTGYTPDPELAMLTPSQWGFAVLCVSSTILWLRTWRWRADLPPPPPASGFFASTDR
jgi:prolipoprotein diacylglyceryltransferase